MAKSSAAGLLTSVDSMFTTQEERDNAQRSYVTDLPIAEISDFPDHPFKVRMDESMTEMVESVKERGVLYVILSIMQEEKPNQVEQFKIPRNRIDKFFPAGTPAQKIEDTIVKALEMYRRRERAMER